MRPLVTGVFVFNIIVGTGCLALPKLFSEAGLALGTIFLLLIAGLASTSASLLLESQSVASVLRHVRQLRSEDEAEASSVTPIDQMAVIVSVLLPPWGLVLWYVVIIGYLFTDLAVYSISIPKSIAALAGAANEDLAYNLSLLALAATVTPMVFFNLKKTTIVQLVTIIVRNAVLWAMIICALAYLPHSHAAIAGPGDATHTPVKQFVGSGIPLLFSGAVYAFMCQQYLPAMFAPLDDRTATQRILLVTMIGVVVIYMLLCWTAVAAFDQQPLPPSAVKSGTCSAATPEACPLQQLYTFNFGYTGAGAVFVAAPLISLLSSFPVIAIVLRDQLITLYWLLSSRTRRFADDPIVRAVACCACCRGTIAEEDDISRSDHHSDDDDDALRVRPAINSSDSPARSPLLRDDVIEGGESAPVLALHEAAREAAGPAGTSRAPPASPSLHAPFGLRVVFGVLAILPGLVISLCTHDIDLLVGITGGYGGALLQFVIPALLAIYARSVSNTIRSRATAAPLSSASDDAVAWRRLERLRAAVVDPTASPFSQGGIVIPLLLIAFGLLCIGFNTYHLITQ